MLAFCPTAIQLYAADGRCVFANAAFLEWFPARSVSDFDLGTEALGEAPLTRAVRRASRGEVVRLREGLYAPPGCRQGEAVRELDVSVTLFPFGIEVSGARAVVVCYVDRSADRGLRYLADALDLSQEQFRATFEQPAFGVAHTSLDGRCFAINQRFCALLGRSREEFVGSLPLADLTHPDDADADRALLHRLRAGELETYSVVKRYVRPDGSVVWSELTVSRARASGRAPGYLVLVAREIAPLLSPGAKDRSESTAEGEAETQTVLVCEDDSSVLRVASTILRRHGYRVLDAPSAREALLLAERHTGEIHLLLTDVMLPWMNGRELSERLAQRRPRMRFLFMSGYLNEDNGPPTPLPAAASFIEKPITPKVLLHSVRRILDAQLRS